MSGFRLDNKVALVIGGGSRIGRAIAVCSTQHGATVRTVDLSERAAQKNLPGKEAEAFAKLYAARPIGRMPEPCEVAMLALYLCCDQASFITRTEYRMGGGFFNL